MSLFITILASILVFGSVIFIHELGHFVTAKLCGIKVNEFSLGMGPALLRFEKGDTTYALRLLPIGGFVSMEGEDEESDDEHSFSKAKVWKRFLVVAAGAVMNMILGFLVLVILVCRQSAITSRTVSVFSENASTQASGLQVGDEILAVNGRRCFIADDVIYELVRTQNGTADLTVLRDGKKVLLEDVVFTTQETEEGTSLIIDFKVLPIEKTFFNVVKEAGLWTCSLSRMIFLSLIDLVTGRVAINNLSGPVGIVTVISEAASIGWEPILLILAVITINLGIFNLIPFPALDGGKLFLLLVEGIRRKALPEKYEIVINLAGFAALMLLMLFVTYNDIARLIVG